MVISQVTSSQSSRRPRSLSRPWLGWWGLLLFALFAAGPVHGSSLIYKNYIVRYDRGWDILCEPYVVKKGDWVLKIFRQKGELAHQDFREFLGIFQRLNPHVQDIDLIRPGQSVDIPLRKLEHGTLPGQASGVVTIPFVSLTRVMDVILQNAQPYQVQRGDTVSQLIARHFGPYGSQTYQEGVKLLQAANPQITDINRIYAGQKIYMPDPSIREKEWYNALYDEEGNLRESIDQKKPAPSNAMPAGDGGTPGAAAAPPVAEPAAEPMDVLAQAAATVGGTLIQRGTYYVPRPGQDDFEVDLSRYPMMDLQSQKVLFTRDGAIMGQSPGMLESIWPGGKVVQYNEDDSVQKVVAGIFQSLEGGGAPAQETEIGFNDGMVHVAVRAKWIKSDSQQRKLCISPIEGIEEQTPDSFRRYLEQNGIVIREVLPGGQAPGAAGGTTSQRHMVKNVLSLAPAGQKIFVHDLSRALHFTYAPNVPVSFNYAGIQIQAFANLVSTPDGHEVLVDFGELYGDAVKSLHQSGLAVLQFGAEDSYATIARKLLTGLNAAFTENPAFMAAARPAQYNTSVVIEGLLYTDPQGQRTLLSGAALPPAVTDLLSGNGIAVVTW